ncbi:unnamed protein product [Ostreobium quekettii]|uniref:Maintenance of Photosystem II under High light 2 C-terminal domain-containing protein n=1 Tax=Ostreobium quekettii TaxID=121088 RepID=A0A8S1IM70_9CHLO|nr:unnamed protein product [Ostreobium quekettii]|eukprot:evm.model.scf_1979.1 EVM.evm.TU.scf_1979.1   scf_1979:1222-1911(+)
MPIGCQASAPLATGSPFARQQPSAPPRPQAAPRRSSGTLPADADLSGEGDASITRRSLLGSALIAPALLAAAAPSWALLPDDDDTDLIEKAKGRRQQRIQADREAERKFVKEGGYRDRRDESVLKPVQTAVFQLSRSGAALESGSLSGVASIIGDGSWVGDFRRAGERLSAGNAAAERSLTQVLSGVGALQAAAKSGGLVESKREFVAVVSAMTAWAQDAGVGGDIKGL